MATSTVLIPPRHYLNDGYGIASWLLTVDHKRIALLYLATITLFFFVGGAMAVLVRLELLTPQGDLVNAETYNKIHHAWPGDGLLLSHTFDSRDVRQFSRAVDGW